MRRTVLLIPMLAATLIGLPATAEDPAIVDAPVTFEVDNRNDSRLPCETDGLPYVMHGTLVSPTPFPARVTVYVPGATGGQWQWGLEGIPGLDNPRRLAADGHATVVIDRLGQGTSGRPHGAALCVGSEADVLHQIVEKLEEGDYTAGSGRGPRFMAVAVAGHSLGSVIALVAAYSFGRIDALVLTGWTHQPTALARFASHLSRVVPRYATCPTDADGYVDVWATPEEAAGDLFYDPDPAVVSSLGAVMEQAACGTQASLGFAGINNQAWAGTIDVPVLVVNGEHDFGFDPHATHIERFRYPSSADVDAVVVPDAGHTFMIERADTARVFRAVVGSWLARRGF